MICACGTETIAALTPGGRVLDLEADHVWIRPGERWGRVYTIGISGRGRAVPLAIPALLELMDTHDPQRPSGPFRREHTCRP